VILDGYLFIEIKAQDHAKASDRHKLPTITTNENKIHYFGRDLEAMRFAINYYQ